MLHLHLNETPVHLFLLVAGIALEVTEVDVIPVHHPVHQSVVEDVILILVQDLPLVVIQEEERDLILVDVVTLVDAVILVAEVILEAYLSVEVVVDPPDVVDLLLDVVDHLSDVTDHLSNVVDLP